MLDHKGVAFESQEIDLIGGGQHDPEYVKLNPNHVVPTLVDDGAVLIESTLINEYLDDAYPEVPMRPADAVGRHAQRMWGKRLDQTVHPATGVVTFAIGPRNLLLQQPEASGSTLGKDKATWADMSESEQVAARVLGFAAELWDEGLTPEISFQPFHLLRAELRAAAETLGYTEASWNAELSDVKGGEEEAEAARPAAATWAEESPLTLDAQRLRAAFERDPALWDDLARLMVRVESALK